MYLPSLGTYKNKFIALGVSYPLKTISVNSTLLPLLPYDHNKIGWPWTEETSPDIYHSKINWPKITIVTPSFNQAQFLEQTIRSVLLQNYPNLEYIIIDGDSTDGSKEILEKYSPWISYWHSEKDRGQGNAINMGFSLASGDYYAWINSDDYYIRGTFFKVAQEFMRSKKDFVYGYAYGYNCETKKLTLQTLLPVLDYFIKIPSIIQPSTFWSAKIHQPIWEELYCALDFELWLRLVKGNRRKLIKEPLSVANQHDNAKTFNPEMNAKWEEDHQKIWSPEAHGTVYEWKRIIFWNKIRRKLHKIFNRP
ncbi:glycosyltransferase family 2 protein [Mucilaginibacter segetis]|uniref:Glycosyltransferase n=1 Tax=Mucilaginibacter segetis TaxID=2793071 RepID=A0A934ULT9_9SPHI|nr:glycosyltransferase family 2 protein [Mucilaginibacter segetis]MBK0378201.1 glycosyltransferase [Mucilaginibacter segetis]